MKRYFSYIIVAAMFLLASATAEAQMTMTTNKSGEMSIIMDGTGTAVINWGDGSSSQTVALSTSKRSVCKHTYSGTNVRTITITGNNITGLSVSLCQLSSLDVSRNTALKSLSCGLNQLTRLDVSRNTALKSLYCNSNEIKSLDVSRNIALTSLDCSSNEIKSLDVSKNTVLGDLSCSDNLLESLDVSRNTALEDLDCAGNNLSGAALNALFRTLHGNTVSGEKTVDIGKNPGSDACDQSVAEGKGWEVYNF